MASATIVNAAQSFPKNVRPPIASYPKSNKHFTNSFSLDHQIQRKYGKTIKALKEEANNMIISNGGGASVSMPKNIRPHIVSYTKSTWDEYFNSFSLDQQVQEKYGEAIEALKEEVKSMLITMANNYSSGNTKTRGLLVLIDTLERLGVAYHFDQEIEELLGQVFNNSHGEYIEDDDDLFITSLQFRLLRQHHYHASCGVFDKFIDRNNKFKENLNDDIMGLLSLYEAAHLRTHREPILDEAVAFSVQHLKRMVQQLESSPLQDHVKQALEIPLHRCGPRLNTHHFISFYEKDDSRNDVLLKLAKLNFNYVQNLYKQELSELSRWWSELKQHSDFRYARDRIVEAYLWGTILYPEPQSSYARMAASKITQVITVVDDAYDNYATLEEAELFTEIIIQKWNIDEIDRLPDYWKIVYKLILREYDDYKRDATKHKKLFSVPYAKETMIEVCKVYYKGVKWAMGQETPSFDDYIIHSMTTACLFLLFSRAIPGFKYVTEETIDCLRSEPNIFKASIKIGRYLDDVSGFERDSTGVDFYMKQHGLSFQETKDKFIELTEDAWKDLNTEWLFRNSQVTKDVVEHALAYARGSEVFCRNFKDGYTKSEAMNPLVAALFVDPII